MTIIIFSLRMRMHIDALQYIDLCTFVYMYMVYSNSKALFLI